MLTRAPGSSQTARNVRIQKRSGLPLPTMSCQLSRTKSACATKINKGKSSSNATVRLGSKGGSPGAHVRETRLTSGRLQSRWSPFCYRHCELCLVIHREAPLLCGLNSLHPWSERPSGGHTQPNNKHGIPKKTHKSQ